MLSSQLKRPEKINPKNSKTKTTLKSRCHYLKIEEENENITLQFQFVSSNPNAGIC